MHKVYHFWPTWWISVEQMIAEKWQILSLNFNLKFKPYFDYLFVHCTNSCIRLLRRCGLIECIINLAVAGVCSTKRHNRTQELKNGTKYIRNEQTHTRTHTRVYAHQKAHEYSLVPKPVNVTHYYGNILQHGVWCVGANTCARFAKPLNPRKKKH